MLTWLHISDLHFRASQTYNASVVLQALVRDIGERMEQDDLRPDFIAVTGDMAFSGQPDEYTLARAFFDGLLAKTGLPRERLFVVPGNHDANRNLVTGGAKAIAAALTDRDSVNTLLATPDDRRLVMARFKGYAEFVEAYLGHLGFDGEHYFYVRPLDVAGRRITLLGLNSAWLCASDKDKADGLLIGERQARTALEQARGADFKIALMHHPFDWLREFDQNDSAAMLTDGCDFILHGHLHQAAMTQLTSPDSSAMILACGACYETRQWPNMYNWVRLNLEGGAGTVYLRRYSDARGGFWAKDTLTYRNVTDGEYRFTLRGAPIQQPKPPADPASIQRRIDAAAPSSTAMDQHIDLLVQVRFPDSPLLGIQDWLTKHKPSSVEQASAPVALEFPVDPQTGKLGHIRLNVRIVSPDFDIEGSAEQLVDVPPDGFSQIVSFLLTPLKEGNCRVNVEVYSVDHVYLGTIPVETVVGEAPAIPTAIVATLVLAVAVRKDRAATPAGQIAFASGGSAAATGESTAVVGNGNVVIKGSVQGGRPVMRGGARPVPPPAKSQGEYDLQAVRELLSAAFSDEEILTLAFDRFRDVYEDISGEMGKGKKIRLLVEWCDNKVVLDELLAEVKRRNPNQYARYAARLRGSG